MSKERRKVGGNFPIGGPNWGRGGEEEKKKKEGRTKIREKKRKKGEEGKREFPGVPTIEAQRNLI